MKNNRFSDEQIIGFLRQTVAVVPVNDLSCGDCFIFVTFYKLLSKFGSMQTSDADKLRKLESENA